MDGWDGLMSGRMLRCVCCDGWMDGCCCRDGLRRREHGDALFTRKERKKERSRNNSSQPQQIHQELVNDGDFHPRKSVQSFVPSVSRFYLEPFAAACLARQDIHGLQSRDSFIAKLPVSYDVEVKGWFPCNA